MACGAVVVRFAEAESDLGGDTIARRMMVMPIRMMVATGADTPSRRTAPLLASGVPEYTQDFVLPRGQSVGYFIV